MSSWADRVSPSTTALLVIDMQVDFLAAEGRLAVDQRRVPALIAAVNSAIETAEARGMLVVHVDNEFPWWSGLNPFRRFAALAGSPGAARDPRVRRGEAPRVPKARSDAFTSPRLPALLTERGIAAVVLAGVFANGCVKATARGALRNGLDTVVLADAVASRSDRATARALEAMRGSGAVLARVDATPTKGEEP